MRKNFGAKTYLYPMPVLIIGTYDEAGNANAMNAAWGGIADTNQIAIRLANHKTTDNIFKNKAFTVSIGTKKMVEACDYVGLISANKEPHKMEHAHFTTTKSEFVNAPIINELPMSLECKFIDFDESTGLLRGEIVNVNADESILTNGVIDPKKLEPITFDPINNTYIVLGDVVGKAFSCGNNLK